MFELGNNSQQADVYQAGGSLSVTFPTYVHRLADDALYSQIRSGNFCYMLTARQMGKSSLRVRTMSRLQQEGYACASVDITAITSRHSSADQWYYTFLYRIARDLGISTRMKTWWSENPDLTIVSRLTEFFEHIVLKEVEKNIVIFIDEIDSVLSLDRERYCTDDFFAAIRSFFNARVDNPAFKRLNFVIIGVATPTDLMNDPERTPFNIGVPIQLDNFSFEQAFPLLTGLQHIEADHAGVLREILRWTGGQPILTQRLCQSVASLERRIIHIQPTVERHVERLFFSSQSHDEDHNLTNVANRIIENHRYNAQMLGVYQQVLSGERVKVENSEPIHLYLKLSGILIEHEGFFTTGNRIYNRKFDKTWLDEAQKRIERPYMNDINRWLSLDKDASAALTGEVLEQALQWASTRDDLSKFEREFFDFSRVEDLRRHKKEAEQQKVLRQRQALRNGVIFVSFMLLVTLIGLGYYFSQQLLLASQHERVKRINDAFKTAMYAKSLLTKNPNHALDTALIAASIDTNELVRHTLYDIYSQHWFYRSLKPSNEGAIITDFVVSPDSETITFVTNDGDIGRIDNNGNETKLISLQGKHLEQICRWNNRYVVKSDDSVITINDDMGNILYTINNTDKYNAIATSDGQTFFAASSKYSLAVYDTTAKILAQWTAESQIVSVAVAHRRNLIACGLGNGQIVILNQQAKIVHTFNGHLNAVKSLDFNTSDMLLLSASNDKTARVWNLETGEEKSLIGHTQNVLSARFADGGHIIATASMDKTIMIWNIEGNILQVLRGHQSSVQQVAFSQNNAVLVSLSRDCFLAWNVTGMPLRKITDMKDNVCRVSFSPDGKTIAAGDITNKVILSSLDAQTQHEYNTYSCDVSSVAFAPDGMSILSSSWHNALLWQLGSNVFQNLQHVEKVNAAIFSPDGKYIVTACNGKAAFVWNAQGKQLATLKGHEHQVTDVAFSPDGSKILTGSNDQTCRLWTLDGKLLRVFEGHTGQINQVTFAANNKWFVSASDDHTARLWDTTGKTLAVLHVAKQKVISVAIDPDCSSIALGLSDKLIQLFDTKGNTLQVYEGHTQCVSSLAFSPDGKYLASGSCDNSVLLWLAKPPLEEYNQVQTIDQTPQLSFNNR